MSGWWQGQSKDSFSQQSVPYGIYHGYVEPFGSSVHVIPKQEDGKCLSEGLPNVEDVMRKFHSFRQFDMVQVVSDHYCDIKGATAKKQSNKWLKRIQEEWKILEKDLPDSIFVRAYDARMDLLSAVIVGAEGTPYHDGLFYFDIYFPPDYPNVPPHFKDFVMGHFSMRAQDIMGACRAYMGGAQVGSLVQGCEQKVNEGHKSSNQLRNTVASYIGLPTKAFAEIGVQWVPSSE